jgi:putative transposase
VKYERMYLRAYEIVSRAKADIAEYIDWYDTGRGHTSLAGHQTPDAAYWCLLPKQRMAV